MTVYGVMFTFAAIWLIGGGLYSVIHGATENSMSLSMLGVGLVLAGVLCASASFHFFGRAFEEATPTPMYCTEEFPWQREVVL